MSFLTLSIEDLRKKWMEVYVNLMLIKSTKIEAEAILDLMKMYLAEVNEELQSYLDKLEVICE